MLVFFIASFGWLTKRFTALKIVPTKFYNRRSYDSIQVIYVHCMINDIIYLEDDIKQIIDRFFNKPILVINFLQII